MEPIILATNNPGKIVEFQALLRPIICVSQASLGIESPEETGLSFVENALIKARFVSRLTQKPALADDSGLVVPCLKGAPGIYSARYAGLQAQDSDNITLLLKNLKPIETPYPEAYFYCAIALVRHAEDPTPIIATGRWMGCITRTPAGASGFGYDPLFYLPDYECTAAQLSLETKNQISHRGQALRQLRAAIGTMDYLL